jgi:hypothetical protein
VVLVLEADTSLARIAASRRTCSAGRRCGDPGSRPPSIVLPREDDADRIQREWQRFPTHVPLDVIEAPYRDLGKPMLSYLRRITADPESVAVVVMPELIVRGTDRLLHNQRALYLKRLLIFEPRVILASVPYQLV